MKPLQDIVIIDFSQFLSGPSASLRLSDLGAEVIKIERPGTGDICRQLYVSDVMIEGESTIFQAINRNKQSYAADLKNGADMARIKRLLAKADVMIHNFRPGVMERLGLDYDTVKAINPQIIYAEVNGYGNEGPWKDLPGQDLLVQAASGLTYLNGNNPDDPTPMGVAVVDIMAGSHLSQGILAAYYNRLIRGEGALVQVNMLESILDFQFEVLTSFYNDGNELPVRSEVNNAHAFLAAPYGIYKTTDGYLALAMNSILVLGKLLTCEQLLQYTDPADWFNKRDEIKSILAAHLISGSTAHWLSILEPADAWCAPVMDYETLRASEGYQVLKMEQEVRTSGGITVRTTRCPLRIDGGIITSPIGAPQLGEHNEQVEKQFGLL